jgi:hypothetical protein
MFRVPTHTVAWSLLTTSIIAYPTHLGFVVAVALCTCSAQTRARYVGGCPAIVTRIKALTPEHPQESDYLIESKSVNSTVSYRQCIDGALVYGCVLRGPSADAEECM